MTAIRHISRFSNIVLIPCLTLSNIGASISFSLFKKVGLLVPIAIGSNLLAMGLGRIFKFVHEDDPKLFLASLLTISSPNSISMPILVMQSLCEQPLVNEDFDNDSSVCFSQSTALLFIYVIGFHILYWGYVFPTFEQLQEDYENGELGLNPKPNEIKNSSLSFRMTKVIALLKHIILSPTMLGVIAGLFFGLIPFTRNLLFSETGYLYPVGGAITTLGSPVVALNCLIMSASLAHIDVDFKKLFLDYWNSVSDNLSPQRRHSIQLSSHEEIDEHKGTAFNPLQQVNLDTQCDDQREGNSEVELKNLEKALTEVIKDDGVEQASVDTSSTSLLNENLNNLPHLRSVVYLIICRYINIIFLC